jgi:hypothetical protein
VLLVKKIVILYKPMPLSDVSNVTKAKANFNRYKGNDNAVIKPSNRKGKKFVVIHNGESTHFGDINLKDFTKTGDEAKRKNYLARSAGIKGDWKKDKYSANRLARAVLWQ